MKLKVKKKPIVVEAMQLKKDYKSIREVGLWCGWTTEESIRNNRRRWDDLMDDLIYNGKGITISTIEGDMLCKWDDYVIKGVKGEFYPCAEDIFLETYDIVERIQPDE